MNFFTLLRSKPVNLFGSKLLFFNFFGNLSDFIFGNLLVDAILIQLVNSSGLNLMPIIFIIPLGVKKSIIQLKDRNSAILPGSFTGLVKLLKKSIIHLTISPIIVSGVVTNDNINLIIGCISPFNFSNRLLTIFSLFFTGADVFKPLLLFSNIWLFNLSFANSKLSICSVSIKSSISSKSCCSSIVI